MSGVLEILRLMGTMKLQNIWSSVWLFFPFSLIFPLLQVKAVQKHGWRGKILRTTSNFFCANSFSRGLMNGLGRGAAFRRYLLLIQLIRRKRMRTQVVRPYSQPPLCPPSSPGFRNLMLSDLNQSPGMAEKLRRMGRPGLFNLSCLNREFKFNSLYFLLFMANLCLKIDNLIFKYNTKTK